MTNDLISRSALHKHLLGPCVAKYPSSFTMGLLAAARELDAAPAVDAVEVVRCGECWHRDPEDKRCEHHMNNNYFTRDDDGFCSYGERRTK